MNNQIQFKPEYLNNLMNNILLDCDSYKHAHPFMLEENTENIYEYMEARIGAKFNELTIYGTQGFIKNYMLTPFTQFMIDQAEWFLTNHGQVFSRERFEYILNNYNGLFPVIIKAAEEGTTIPVGCPYYTVENSTNDPNTSWCAAFIETKLMRTWAPIAVATQSNFIRKLILKYLEETGTPELIDWKMIDFGARGVSSKETNAILSSAHLTSGRGTDSLLGIAYAMTYYNESEVLGESIPATEHSVTLARGKENELQFYLDMVEKFLGPNKMVSIVLDSYDLDVALDMLGTQVKPYLLAKGGTIVCRPDSGIPLEQVMNTLKKLDHYFGHSINEKGYKVLNPAVRIIQGDGITEKTIYGILQTMKEEGWSADNVTFGSGGFLLQSPTRDLQRTAYKASHVTVNGVSKGIRKEVKTDPSKASKAGRVTTVLRNGIKLCVKEDEIIENDVILLKPVYDTGKLLNEISFSEIRNNVKKNK